MAKTGSTSVTFTQWDSLRFSWEIKSQNVSANTSTVSWKMELVSGQYGEIIANEWSKSDWKVTVNSVEYTGKENIGIGNNTTKTLASGETTITHKTDGSQSFTYSFSQTMHITFSGEYISIVSGDGSGTLDTIPRATTPTVSNDNVSMGSLIRINTPRASANFTHNLDYSFAGGEWVSIRDGVGTYYDWTTPDLASQIPNSPSGTLTIRCITKNNGTTIGTAYTTMTLRVNDSVVPTVSVSVSEATPGIAAQIGGYVKGKSTLKVVITAAGAKGSTIKSYYSTFDGRTYSESSFTTPTLSTNDTLTLKVTVTDSRGRTASTSVDIVVMGYAIPAISTLQVYRVNSAGETDPDGTYVAVRYAYSVQPLQNKNTASMVLEYKRSIDTTWSTLLTNSALSADTTVKPTGTTFSTDYQYDIRMTVTDWFGSAASYPTTLPTGAVILDIKADGKGVAFGKTSEFGGIELGWDIELNGHEIFENGLPAFVRAGNRPYVQCSTEAELEAILNEKLASMQAHETMQMTVNCVELASYNSVGVLHSTHADGYAIFNFYGFNSAVGVTVARKIKQAGTWYPVEYDNPRMMASKEYRTTERWKGKAVYIKMVSLGALPNNTIKTYTSLVSSYSELISFGVFSTNGTVVIQSANMYWDKSISGLVITSTSNQSSYTATALLKYTK